MAPSEIALARAPRPMNLVERGIASIAWLCAGTLALVILVGLFAFCAGLGATPYRGVDRDAWILAKAEDVSLWTWMSYESRAAAALDVLAGRYREPRKSIAETTVFFSRLRDCPPSALLMAAARAGQPRPGRSYADTLFMDVPRSAIVAQRGALLAIP